MALLGFLLVLVTSSLNAVQSACNARLQKGVAQPFLAAAWVYAVGLTGLLATLAVALAARGRSAVPVASLSRVPWWSLPGGLLGACYILAMVTQTERLGSGTFMALSFVGTITTAVLLDHFGCLGLKPHPAGWGRLLGCLVMAAGVAMVAAF